MSERLGAFEGESSYGDEPFQGPRVLWGRVGVLGGALVLCFLLGRLTAPGGSSANVTALQDQVTQLQSKNAQLQSELGAANGPGTGTGTGTTTQSPSSGLGTGGTTTTTVPSPSSGPPTSYTVKSGDTLGGIAVTVYGSDTPQLVALLEQANNIASPSALRVGVVLHIPPASQASTITVPSPSPGASPKASPKASPHPSPSPSH